MGGPRITDDQKQKMIQMREDGISVSKIARTLSVSEPTVRKVIRGLVTEELLEGEVLRAIDGFGGKYQISSYGRVFSTAMGVRLKPLKTQPAKKSGGVVCLVGDNGVERHNIDDLVSSAFLGSREPGQLLEHLDGDRANSRADNLRWVYPPEKPEKKPLVDDAGIADMRTKWVSGMLVKDIAAEYGVSTTYVYVRVRDLDREVKMPDSEPGEHWKDVEGYEGLYMVSSLGRVYSTGRGRYRGTIMCPADNRSGYLILSLRDLDGKDATCPVHRLVALAFCYGHDSKHDVVNHKDGNKHNNHADNLEWCTSRENTVHAVEVLGKKTGGIDPFIRASTRTVPVDPSSRPSPYRRFTDDEVRAIRTDIRSSRQLARLYGVNKCTIQRIRSGESYKNI